GGVRLVLLGASAAYSATAWGLRARYRPPASYLAGRPAAAPDGAPAVGAGAGGADAPDARPAHDVRSQPWWQPLVTVGGRASGTTEEFVVDRHALQWRVSWRCSEGAFRAVPVGGSGAGRRPLADAGACPARGTGYSVRTGRFAVGVTTPGAWEVTVEQQVDSPMVEAPPAGLDDPAARPLATGSVYDVDRTGRGTARIVALPDGRRVLRLEEFFVSMNSDLEIWFSEHPHPTSTPEAASAPHRQLAFLKATAGSMTYELPADLDVSRYRSIVIWCELTSNAYAAAVLQSPSAGPTGRRAAPAGDRPVRPG
ncbi:MAG: DM13 domain-containing protein, partial [Acidimicrobiia bacterium]